MISDQKNNKYPSPRCTTIGTPRIYVNMSI
nr:MAG TPA: hypothetical protein [Caudoviricetes sp.]